MQDLNVWPPEEKSKRDEGGGKKEGKKVILAVAFSSGALGEAPSMAAVPVCVCVRQKDGERDQVRGGKGSGCTPLSPLQPHTDTFAQTYMQQQ